VRPKSLKFFQLGVRF